METRRIDLKGNRSLINNKAHIDEAWQKFSKNNSPYLRDALVPHYLKSENKEIASNIVFDKKGNKYYVNNNNFYINDESVVSVSSTGFKKTDLDENYQCYYLYKDYQDVTHEAYILDNILYCGETVYQLTYDVLYAQFNDTFEGLLCVVLYKNEYNELYVDLIDLDLNGYVDVESFPVEWGQLINGTTWTPVTNPEEVTSYKCNITSHTGFNGLLEPWSFTGISLIGNASVNTKESDIYIFNIVRPHHAGNQWYMGSDIQWEALSGSISVNYSWDVRCNIVHERPYGFSGSNAYLQDDFIISLSDSSQSHSGTPINVTITYTDGEDQTQTLTGSFSTTQRQITLSRYIREDIEPNFREHLGDLFNITSIVFSQKIDGTTYTKTFPLEDVTFNPGYTSELWRYGFTNKYSFNLAPYINEGAPAYLNWAWTITETIAAPSTKCNIFAIDNSLRSLPVYSYKASSINEYIVKAHSDGYEENDGVITISYIPDLVYKNTSTYTYFASSAYNINQNYFDVLFSVFDSSYTESKTHNFYTNTGMEREIIGDIGMTNDGTTPYVNGSAKGKLWYTQYGAVAPFKYTNWRLLYNYGTISNISWGELGEEGSILCDWNTIDDRFEISCTDTEIVYKDIEGIHKITIEELTNNIQIFEDNYVLINTTSYLNCYDIRKGKMVHFASDFNNRCYTGWQASSYGFFVGSGSWKDAWESNKWESDTAVMYCAAGQNVNYMITGNPIASSIFPPQNLYHVVKGKEFYFFGNNADIEVYYNLLYVYTISKNSGKSINQELYPDAQYPLASNNVNYFNIPLLLELIKTYNNKDMVKAGSMYYPVIYYNDVTPIFIYSTLGGLDGASDMFVIQSQFYAVMNGKICAVSYADNIIAGVEAIIDVTGMEFIGYLPTFALFYSPKNKCIYSFTGDANLELIEDASEIGELRNALYNSFTKTIHVITDKGVCIIGDTIYMIEFPDIAEMFFTEEKTVLETEDKIYYLSFDKLSDEYEVMPLEFETEFFGGVNDSVITIYKWSMRFIKDAVTNGTIKLSTVTLTDKGSETREKVYNLTAKDWDPLTDSFYLQFAPENNKACGHKIRIESDFPLTSLVAQITTDGSLAAAKNSLKI